MAGGRGLLSDVAVGLNNGDPKKYANSIKVTIEAGEYVFEGSLADIGKAYGLTEHYDELGAIWCTAIENKAVNWAY